jgi:hypothetical protein
MAQELMFSPKQMNDELFNQLPLLSQAKQEMDIISDKNEELFTNLLSECIGNIIIKNNMQDKIQATLIHKHYDLKNNEYQIAKIINCLNDNNCCELIAEPTIPTNGINSLISCKWSLFYNKNKNNYDWYSFEYFDNKVPCSDLYQQYSEEFEKNTVLQNELKLLLIKYNLQNIIGISLQFQPLLTNEHGGMAVEVNNVIERQSKLLLINKDYQQHDAYKQIQNLPTVNTAWRFYVEYGINNLNKFQIKGEQSQKCKGKGHHSCICVICW